MPTNELARRGAELFRSTLEIKRATITRSDDGGVELPRPIMRGYFAVFNVRTEVDNWYEGHFFETIKRGAFAKSITESRSRLRSIYHHGLDINGERPIGSILDMGEDEYGAWAEVELLDSAFTHDYLEDALEAGVLGASFRGTVMQYSEDNTRDIPEQTVTEIALKEFGPCPLGVYADAGFELQRAVGAVGIDRTLDHLLGDPAIAAQLAERLGVTATRSAGTATEPVTADSKGGTEPEPVAIDEATTPTVSLADRRRALLELSPWKGTNV